MKKLLLLLLTIAFVYGCEKDEPILDSSGLTGEWSLIIACGDLTCNEPSENDNFNYLFTVDSLVYYFHNDSLVFSKRYYVYKRFSEESNDTIEILAYGSGTMRYILNKNYLTLILLNSYYGHSEWKRIKQIHFP